MCQEYNKVMENLEYHDPDADRVLAIYNDLKLMLESCEWKLLSEVPKDNTTILDVLCDRRHPNKFTQEELRNGAYCKSCITPTSTRMLRALDKFRSLLAKEDIK